MFFAFGNSGFVKLVAQSPRESRESFKRDACRRRDELLRRNGEAVDGDTFVRGAKPATDRVCRLKRQGARGDRAGDRAQPRCRRLDG